MKIIEFNIEGRDETFRNTKISPIDLLAISGQIDFDDFEKTKKIITVATEHLEVKIGEKWFPVKVKDREVFQPMGIEENLELLQNLTFWFIENIISPAFQKSSE